MPKLKLANKPQAPPNLTANIAWIMQRRGWKAGDLAELIGVSQQTIYNRMNAPETFVLEELIRIATLAGMDLQELQFGTVTLKQREEAV